MNAEKKMDSEAYEMLCELFRMPHIDNMRVLKALIYSRDDILPLYDGYSKKRVCSSNTVITHRMYFTISLLLNITQVL